VVVAVVLAVHLAAVAQLAAVVVLAECCKQPFTLTQTKP
jgi:hypothetical protein